MWIDQTLAGHGPKNADVIFGARFLGLSGLMIHFWVPCTRLSPD